MPPLDDMPLDDAYLVWLYSQVGSVDSLNRAKTYWTLLRLLYKKEFDWSHMAMDENRAHDGKDLRREFANETGADVDIAGWMELPCSMLEMMVAMAVKMSFDGGRQPKHWFWELIDNLGLTECNDAHPPIERIVDEILDKVLLRDYLPNGLGGLFPLNEPRQDQRDVELWYQAQAYLLERI